MERRCKEHVLEEIPVCLEELGDALRCILHSILFVRAPGAVRPSETTCDYFNITFARVGVRDVDLHVDGGIESLKNYLVANQTQRGKLVVNFFERQVKKALFGLMSNEERSICEKWIIPVSIHETGGAVGRRCDQNAALEPELERQRRQQSTEVVLQNSLLQVLSAVQHIEHMPTSMYEYEISL